MTLAEQVRAQATQQANGRWTFEGKDTYSWDNEATHHRTVWRRMRAEQPKANMSAGVQRTLERKDMMLEAMEIADTLLLLDTSTLAQAQVAALEDAELTIADDTHPCAHCHTPMATDYPYAYCEQCQETKTCQHGVLYKEDCSGCNTLSDFAYDAWREKR